MMSVEYLLRINIILINMSAKPNLEAVAVECNSQHICQCVQINVNRYLYMGKISLKYTNTFFRTGVEKPRWGEIVIYTVSVDCYYKSVYTTTTIHIIFHSHHFSCTKIAINICVTYQLFPASYMHIHVQYALKQDVCYL